MEKERVIGGCAVRPECDSDGRSVDYKEERRNGAVGGN